jgi:hypothetical protein
VRDAITHRASAQYRDSLDVVYAHAYFGGAPWVTSRTISKARA